MIAIFRVMLMIIPFKSSPNSDAVINKLEEHSNKQTRKH